LTKKERSTLLWIWVFLGLLPLFLRPLWEPDEARYAEIPREMLAAGDWLTPRLNHVLYFEKPPLQYWLSALSMKAFGLNAVAARLPLALATFIGLWCAWKLAQRLGARQAFWAPFMAGTALLGFVCGQILTLDALFSAFQVLALVAGIEAVAARFEGDQGTGWSLLAFGALALAMLTKGLAAPVLVGGVLLCSLPFAWSSPRARPRASASRQHVPWTWRYGFLSEMPSASSSWAWRKDEFIRQRPRPHRDTKINRFWSPTNRDPPEGSFAGKKGGGKRQMLPCSHVPTRQRPDHGGSD